MRKVRIAKRIFLGLGLLISLATIASLATHAFLTYRAERATAIRTPKGIDEARFFRVGGINQWVQIRGTDRDNPALLFLHGGPGASSIPISGGFRSWEDHFVVIQWDQRGAGKTYRENRNDDQPFTVSTMTEDGLDLSEQLRHYLGKRKLLLVGHSWGSALGILMVQKRPDLFSAFVGTGQFVAAKENEEVNYGKALAAARAAHNGEALNALERLGPPPWSNIKQYKVERFWGDLLAEHNGYPLQPSANFLTPHMSLIDYLFWSRGLAYSFNHLLKTLSELNLRKGGTHFSVPIFFFQGTSDNFTPIEPLKDYFATMQARHKELVLFIKITLCCV